jgi:saccharopine dehydrogenase-like NADP-dependent oxidoreductase
MRVLLLGGYGAFGGRLAKLLCEERIEIVIAGRSLAKAKRFAEELAGAARTELLEFDRDGDVDAQLRTARAGIVVDASGPFQA